MNKALIIDENSVTIVEIENWFNYNKDYIKLLTRSGKILICSSGNIILDLNRENIISDEELILEKLGRLVEIKHYEETKEHKLIK